MYTDVWGGSDTSVRPWCCVIRVGTERDFKENRKKKKRSSVEGRGSGRTYSPMYDSLLACVRASREAGVRYRSSHRRCMYTVATHAASLHITSVLNLSCKRRPPDSHHRQLGDLTGGHGREESGQKKENFLFSRYG